MRLLTVFGLFVALSQYSTAQRAAHAITPHSATPHLNSATGSFAFGRTFGSRFRQPFPYTSLPFPFFADSFNPDDLYSTGYPVASQPPVILLQAARALAGPAEAGPAEYADRQPAPAQPLMIELQNGRYVRVNSAAADGEALPLNLAPDRTPSPPSELAPVLLVFRDGHSEEVRNYTIADGILYASGDYYTDGYWNKKIALSTINLQQTLEANAKRNVKFGLPESPNEVITRP
ncbi:MAG: hypothetical protein WAK89_07675 [Candidatus Sulfotelmatobacter sp.]